MSAAQKGRVHKWQTWKLVDGKRQWMSKDEA